MSEVPAHFTRGRRKAQLCFSSKKNKWAGVAEFCKRRRAKYPWPTPKKSKSCTATVIERNHLLGKELPSLPLWHFPLFMIKYKKSSHMKTVDNWRELTHILNTEGANRYIEFDKHGRHCRAEIEHYSQTEKFLFILLKNICVYNKNKKKWL